MPRFHGNFRAFLLAGAAGICLSSSGAMAAGFTVNPAPPTDTVAKTVSGGDTGTIAAGGILSAATPITWSLTPANSTAVLINNSGTITATGSTRGIDTSGSGTPRSFTFNNLTAGSILSSTSDAFRVNGDIGAGTVTVDNFGTIRSTSASGGRALSFNAGIVSAAANISITNELGGAITAAGDDAIRPGTGHVTILNSGNIQSTASGATVGRAINLNTTNLNSLQTFSLTNNAAGTIQSPGDAVRITAGTLQANSAYVVSVDNYGTIQATGTGANNGQAFDFNDLNAAGGSITITNRATGLIQAADADAIRPGSGATVNNYGSIIAQNAPGSTGSDGVDFQTYGGTVNNYANASITGARDGITGDGNQTIFNAGSITGQDGSGINIDTLSGTTTVTNAKDGIITGTAKSGDGDGIDVDHLVAITNSGTIRAVGSFAGEINEALAIGGGSVVNNQGGLITSVERAITVNDSNLGNAFGAIAIDNAGTITGQSGEAIKIVSTFDNSLTNRATGIINGSVAMGSANDTVTLYGGSALNGALDGGGGNDTVHLAGSGSGTLANVSNVEALKVDGGSWTIGAGSYSAGVTVAAGATAQIAGALGGDVTNNGTVLVSNVTVSFTGTFQDNGALVSDPATLSFNNLSVGSAGIIQAAAGDRFKVGGDFTNQSTQNAAWDTDAAILEFTGAPGSGHNMDLAGSDLGDTLNVQDDFAWGALVLDSGNSLTLKPRLGIGSAALYLGDLLGALVGSGIIDNIFGSDGLTIYYDRLASANAYLGGMTYALAGGGRLVAAVPEPVTAALFGGGLIGLVALRRRTRRKSG